MAKPYSKERKIEILTYARDHGVVVAGRKFNVPHVTIRRWNKEYKIYTPQTAEYPIEQRRQILEYVAQNGIKAGARHFKVSARIIELWNKELKIYKPSLRKYTREHKLEILYYARDYGVMAAADKYDIGATLIIRWNNKMHVYQTGAEYTEQDKKRILMFARDNGIAAAEREFDVPGNTMLRWNKVYNIYIPKPVPNYTEYSVPERIKLLQRAKQLYDEMPVHNRSANRAFISLATEYDVTTDQLQSWNKKHKIVPARSYKRATLTQAEIDGAQTALTVARGRVRQAARQSGLSTLTIKKLQTDKKIAFERGQTQLTTNPPVGRNKTNAISAILQMLHVNATRRPKK